VVRGPGSRRGRASLADLTRHPLRPRRASALRPKYLAIVRELPFKTSSVGRFYVTPTGDDPVMLRQEHNSAALADLAAHEGFPGHDWHYKVMSKYRDEVSAVRWLTPGAVEDSSSMWQDSGGSVPCRDTKLAAITGSLHGSVRERDRRAFFEAAY
jgi:hypothetical protein